jgi:hypothetical protein
MSIVRVGLGETAKFAEGYEAIFGKKKPAPASPRGRKAGQKAKSGKKTGAASAKKKKPRRK